MVAMVFYVLCLLCLAFGVRCLFCFPDITLAWFSHINFYLQMSRYNGSSRGGGSGPRGGGSGSQGGGSGSRGGSSDRRSMPIYDMNAPNTHLLNDMNASNTFLMI